MDESRLPVCILPISAGLSIRSCHCSGLSEFDESEDEEDDLEACFLACFLACFEAFSLGGCFFLSDRIVALLLEDLEVSEDEGLGFVSLDFLSFELLVFFFGETGGLRGD